MASVKKSQSPHQRIIVGLPDIQDQIRMVNRLAATESEREIRDGLGNLLYDLYTQLQHQKQVTIYRFGGKSSTAADAARQPARKKTAR